MIDNFKGGLGESKMKFLVGVVWCFSGWVAWRIGQKLDGKTYNWQDKVCGLIFGPAILVPLIIEYLKRKKRAKYTPIERLNKKDIFTLWDWLFYHDG